MSETGAISTDVTEDRFLNGRIVLRQPRKGYRAGIDAVFLAAAIPCRPGESAFEAGMGAGAASLCLAARVPGARVTGIERNEVYAALARQNIAGNGMGDRVRLLDGDVRDLTRNPQGTFPPVASFDHVFANPPYHKREDITASPSDPKAEAHSMAGAELETWVKMLAAMARPRGTITLVQRPEALPRLLQALEGRAGDIRIAPLFPRPHEAASLIILQAVKGSRAAMRLLPGMVLHGPAHGFTDAAEAVLRHGAAFPLR
ncbi:tRNA1(Val) (adenine(37)-N6)-methyltransferase [Rhodoligotrophos defluvii]|uniref:tRNA1(Val) (adenine(37)-N6)-methyltransferase n=1 Tax=Rhodoligotrophos defluvii TaxID=2561934 RepID=UPI0010C95670|nr:methyltransferase domain-containing protein [Rhodoligotrophos defluvii]